MIEARRHKNILEIVINNPPVNALAMRVREGLSKAIAVAQSDETVKVIVIRGAGKLFSAGADITEFDKSPSKPSLPEVIDAIEASRKPVLAAIHGAVLGGGLEIALGCHYRIATRGAKLGLPEVTLGLLPGAGGTQRLPRLIGVEAALDMIVSGNPILATRAIEIGLIDRLAGSEDLLMADAFAYACTLHAPRRASERSVKADPEVFETFSTERARIIKDLDAPKACIDAVKTATELTLSEGQEKERALFRRLVGGDQSKALRHAFFAERAAAKIDGIAKDINPRPITKVGVIGAGTMGGGISMNFMSAGIPVALLEMTHDALNHGTDVIRRNYDASAAKGRLTAVQVEKAMSLIAPTLNIEALKDCDLIIEAVYENMDLKKQVFARLDGIAKPGAILASNTSFLSIDEIASSTQRPQDVLGLHFFSPANVMKLLEVVRGAKTSGDVLATGMELARRIGKVAVVSRVCYGFIGNRMLIPRQENAITLLLEGATPAQIDRVHTAFGMPMGPFQMADLAGVDIGWHREPSRIESLQDALCAKGRWGQKTKAGFYDYDEKRRPSPSSVVAEIIAEFRAKAAITARNIADEEIIVRTLYTLVNEGAKILEESVAQRASDIDVVWNHGYGWPRHTGGPMFWADRVGLKTIVANLRRYVDHLGSNFSLSPLLIARAEQGNALDK